MALLRTKEIRAMDAAAREKIERLVAHSKVPPAPLATHGRPIAR